VLGWFSAQEDELAKGIRQSAPPIGAGLAEATSLPLPPHVGFEVAVPLPAMRWLTALNK
jgi:hypothetical protein